MINQLLNQTLDSINSVTRNVYGTPSLTSVYTDVTCRWQQKFERIVDAKGAEVVATIQCWLAPTHNGSQITIDTGYVFVYNSVEYTVLAITTHVDLDGVLSHYKVYLK